jgi:DNA-binding beta-propeller fold protein YncE
VKPAAIAICLSAVLAVRLPAQNFDIDAARSDDQLRAGVQAFHRGLFNEAVVSFEKAITLQPSNVLARTWLGRGLLRAGYEPQAAKTWEGLVQAGAGGALLRDQLQVLRMRSGLGRELARTGPFAVSARLEGTARGGHPFRRPTSVRPRADGSFYLVAFGSNEVLLYDANFRLSAALKGGLEGFDRPWDVLEAGDGTLFVSEYGGNRIARCGPGGEKTATFGTKGRGDGALLGPQYLAADDRGYLYVTDWGNSRVVKFDRDGAWILNVGGLAGPTGVAVRDDRLYVSEKSARRISVFDLNGNPLATVGEGVLAGPEGLSFSRAGSLLVADGNLVRECDLENESWSVRADPGASAVRLVQQGMGANGDILAADFDGSRVLLFSDASTLSTGFAVRIARVNAVRFPEVFLDVTVETRMGDPVVGLEINNFIVSESRGAVRETALVLSNTAAAALDAAIVVERSPAFDRFGAGAAALIGDLRDLVSASGRALAVSAGEKPVREADFGEARLRMTARVLEAAPSAAWRFDLAARTAGDALVQTTSTARRAVVFLTSGTLGARPFRTYSLEETAAFFRNNAIAFYPVSVGTGGVDGDLAFLASETGGRAFSASLPGGMAEVVRTMRARVGPTYTIRFLSRSDGAFGTKYIPLEIETTLQKMSGRDEAGYFAPPSD